MRHTISVLLVVAGAAVAAHAQSITTLGVLPGHDASTANAISADGTTVVGYSVLTTDSSHPIAFRWTSGTGMTGLGAVGGFGTIGKAVSADGSVVVGLIQQGGAPQGSAFRWADGVMQDIGAGSQFSWTDARAVSADGQRVAGAYQLGSTAAFSWTPQGGIVALAGLTTGAFARAQAISGDGLTVVGLGVQGTASTTVRWAGAGVPESLGIFPGVANSQATATNSDASVIVGFGLSSSNRALAYRWTPGHGMRDLGTIGGGSNNSAMAWGVSEDGFVIVGNHDTNPPLPTWGTFFWTPVLGMRDLWTFLQSTGADPSGWLGFDAAYAVSADGRRIVGTGAYTGATGRERAWMATLPAWATCYANCDGSSQAPALSSSDFTCFLQHYAAGDPYANCDGSTVAPVINTSDLTCFLRKYAAGCN